MSCKQFLFDPFLLFENVLFLLEEERRKNEAYLSQIHNFIGYDNNEYFLFKF